jgi:hypothetical protein
MSVQGITLLILTSLIAHSAAYSAFKARIPNGNNVPDPCKAGSLWAGVGHWSPAGRNARNPFGLAFKANGFVSYIVIERSCKPTFYDSVEGFKIVKFSKIHMARRP